VTLSRFSYWQHCGWLLWVKDCLPTTSAARPVYARQLPTYRVAQLVSLGPIRDIHAFGARARTGLAITDDRARQKREGGFPGRRDCEEKRGQESLPLPACGRAGSGPRLALSLRIGSLPNYQN
jgi:hypothetical protein